MVSDCEEKNKCQPVRLANSDLRAEYCSLNEQLSIPRRLCFSTCLGMAPVTDIIQHCVLCMRLTRCYAFYRSNGVVQSCVLIHLSNCSRHDYSTSSMMLSNYVCFLVMMRANDGYCTLATCLRCRSTPSCGITDADMPDLIACFDNIGRSSIQQM